MKCRRGQVEDISQSKASPSYGNVREHRPGARGAGCHKADAGKFTTSRPVRARDLCRKCVVSRRTLRCMMGQEGCRVYHCCRHTMVSTLKLDHNEVPVLLCKSIEGAFCQSFRTHPDHTPHVDFSSLFVHSHK